MIPRRRLGKTGPEVSALGVGAMSFTDAYGETTADESFAVLDAAVEAGVDHIDTSNVYGAGRSEEVIGQWIKARGENPFKIATKAGITKDAKGNRSFDNSAKHLEAELDGSLKRLGLERVDLFYVHRRDPRIEIEEVTETLAGLIRKGKIASFGYSEIAPTSLARAEAVHPVAAVQNEYSLQTRLPELGLLQETAARGVALVAFSSVGRGLLSDTPPDAARAAQSFFLKVNPRFTGGNLDRNVAATAPFRALAAEAGTSAAALAIAWVLSQGDHVHTIPGTRSAAHFAELVAGASMTLSDDLKREIEARLPLGWCHGARYSDAQNIGPESYG